MSSSTHSDNTSGHFTNANTGAKNADPYVQANADNQNVSLKEKIDDLTSFVDGIKFGMMTTRQNESGLLVSRCMALAARENGVDLIFHTNTETQKTDELQADPHVNLAFIKSSNVSLPMVLPSGGFDANGKRAIGLPSRARPSSKPTERRSESTTARA